MQKYLLTADEINSCCYAQLGDEPGAAAIESWAKEMGKSDRMELCEILTHVFGHNNWHNPYRNAGFSIGGSKNTPFQAFQELDDPFQRIVVSFFGKYPEKTDGLSDLSAPIEY